MVKIKIMRDSLIYKIGTTKKEEEVFTKLKYGKTAGFDHFMTHVKGLPSGTKKKKRKILSAAERRNIETIHICWLVGGRT